MSSEEENKKILVKAEIIDKGYKIEDFTNYIKRAKNQEEINLETWTIQEIASIIKDFINKKKSNNGTNITQNPEFTPVDILASTLKISDVSPLPKDDFVKTKVLQSPGKINEMYPISITEFEKVPGGVFSFTSFLFTIEVKELNTKRKRTYSDFEWIKTIIEKYYPTTYIPPLPVISFFHSYTDKYINKKVRYLNRFLTSLMENELVRKTKVFYDFISMSEEEFKDLIDTYKKKDDPPSTIKKYETLQGSVMINTGKEKDDFAEKIKFVINNRDLAYEKLNVALRDVIEEFEIVSQKINKLSVAFDDIKKTYSDNTDVQEVFNNYKEITSTWSHNYIKQKEVFKIEFKEFFKYVRSYTKDFSKMYNDFQTAKYNFMNQYIKYDDITNINEKDQKQLNKLRKKYGYNLNRVIEEYKLLNYHNTVIDFQNQLAILNSKKEILYSDFISCSNLLNVSLHPN